MSNLEFEPLLLHSGYLLIFKACSLKKANHFARDGRLSIALGEVTVGVSLGFHSCAEYGKAACSSGTHAAPLKDCCRPDSLAKKENIENWP